MLIDACYDREVFPTLEEALDWCWASTDEEICAVKFVLGKFFDLDNGVYIQNRISEEIKKYHENAETNKRIAKEREAKKREKRARLEKEKNEALNNSNEGSRSVHEACADESRIVNESAPNQEPITNNQEPIINTPTECAPGSAPPQTKSKFDIFWQEYPIKKNRKKALEIWKRKKLDSLADDIISKLNLIKKTDSDWLRGFVPHATTFLNGERWDDEIVKEVAPKGGSSEEPPDWLNEIGNQNDFIEGEVIRRD